MCMEIAYDKASVGQKHQPAVGPAIDLGPTTSISTWYQVPGASVG